MKGVPICFVLLVFITSVCNAQSDTTIVYFNKEFKETSKDSAVSYAKFSGQGNLWYGKVYLSKNNVLKSEGTYLQKNFTTPVGSFKNYDDKGVLENIAEYDNGKPLEKTFFYKNGNKMSWISYKGNSSNQQKGWDESGKELRNYVVEKEARFKGGAEGWRKFLEKTLNANVAVESGAPAGDHTVMVQFVVSTEGYVSSVKAVETPASCKPCAKEAVAVLTQSPPWEPAVQNNVPVIYQARQYITFQVLEEKKKRGRN